MSYYQAQYIPLQAGTPAWQLSPVPSWGLNPLNAGPRRVGVGACLSCAGIGAEDYQKTTWGHVAAAAAGALIVGVLFGYAAGKRKGSSLTPNRSIFR